MFSGELRGEVAQEAIAVKEQRAALTAKSQLRGRRERHPVRHLRFPKIRKFCSAFNPKLVVPPAYFHARATNFLTKSRPEAKEVLVCGGHSVVDRNPFSVLRFHITGSKQSISPSSTFTTTRM